MKRHRISACLALLSMLSVMTAPAFGVNKDMVQLQTQVQQLYEQMRTMQTNFDEKMGVMNNLVQTNSDAMNKLVASLTALETTLQKQQADSGAKADQLSGQI